MGRRGGSKVVVARNCSGTLRGRRIWRRTIGEEGWRRQWRIGDGRRATEQIVCYAVCLGIGKKTRWATLGTSRRATLETKRLEARLDVWNTHHLLAVAAHPIHSLEIEWTLDDVAQSLLENFTILGLWRYRCSSEEFGVGSNHVSLSC